ARSLPGHGQGARLRAHRRDRLHVHGDERRGWPAGCRPSRHGVSRHHVPAVVPGELHPQRAVLPARSGEGDIAVSALRNGYEAPLRTLDDLGRQLAFYLRTLAWIPRVVTHYPREILRPLSEVTFGRGALAVIGGTVGVIFAMSFFTGVEVGMQGQSALEQ